MSRPHHNSLEINTIHADAMYRVPTAAAVAFAIERGGGPPRHEVDANVVTQTRFSTYRQPCFETPYLFQKE